MLKKLNSMNVTAQTGQSIFDICLQEFGNLDYVVKISRDNNISISTPLETKQGLTIDNESLGNQKVKDYYTLNSIKPNNEFVNVQKSTNFVFEDGDNFIFEDDNNFIFN